MAGGHCRRCGAVPYRWADLSTTARTIVALVQLGRDVDVPAAPSVIAELRSYLRHEPHTVLHADAKRQRARRHLEGGRV